jgi:uncharacterized OsmC-like protein
MAETQAIKNGVDTQALAEIVHELRRDGCLAQSKFTARGRWLGGAHNRTTIGNFTIGGNEQQHQSAFVFDKDEPQALLGKDQGANPVEYLLAGLAGCLTTTLVMHAAARGIEIRSVETALEGDIDLRGLLAISPEIRAGYQQIRVTFKIDSDASEEDLKELAAFARIHSPVCNTITDPVEVLVSLA